MATLSKVAIFKEEGLNKNSTNYTLNPVIRASGSRTFSINDPQFSKQIDAADHTFSVKDGRQGPLDEGLWTRAFGRRSLDEGHWTRVIGRGSLDEGH